MKDLTDVTILLDRSGSMFCFKDKVISGLNEYVECQKKLPGAMNLSLYQFDTQYFNESTEDTLVLNNIDIKNVPTITDNHFTPRGGTALNDAIFTTINNMGKRFSEMKEEYRPNRVILVIFTDGAENSSKIANYSQVNEVIKRQEDVYSWQILFVGSTYEGQKEGDKYVMSNSGKMSFDMASDYAQNFVNISKATYKMRSSVDGQSFKASIDTNTAGSIYY